MDVDAERETPSILRRHQRARIPGMSASTNPIRWRELYFVYRGMRHEWKVCAGVVLLLVALMGVMMLASGQKGLGAMIGWWSAVAGCCGLIFGLTTVVRASRAFNAEKSGRTLDLLLLSDLTDNQIVYGKLWALFTSTSPWLLTALIGGSMAACLSAIDEPVMLLMFLAYIVQALIGIVAFSILAMSLSLRHKTAATLAISIGGYFIWNSFFKTTIGLVITIVPAMLTGLIGYLTDLPVLGVMGAGGIIMLGGVVMDVFLVGVFLAMLRTNFRRAALKPI